MAHDPAALALAREILRLETPRLVLTLPPPEAAGRVLAFFERNQEHFAPWDPRRPKGFLTEAFWRERLARNQAELEAGSSIRLMLFRRGEEQGSVVGTCNFTQLSRGPFNACSLGYSLDQRATGQGLMTEALQAAIAHVFDERGFHRIMANYMPANERSGRVLRRLGFAVEGYARDYLYIAGGWRDHILTSLTNPRPTPPLATPEDLPGKHDTFPG